MAGSDDIGVDAREERERLAAADANPDDAEDGETGGPVDRPAAGRTGEDVTGVNPSKGGTMETDV